MTPSRILVVEDEPLIRLFVADTLQDAGFHVEEAANATEAAARVIRDSAPFAAAVIDLGLPDRRGDALAAELRQTWQGLPIVIASGHDTTSLTQHYISDGRVRVLGKPYSSAMLLGALRAMGVHPAGSGDPS